MTRYTLYSAAGSGGVAVEAALTLMGLAYDLVEGATWTGDPEALARVERVNPMKQVPALITPDGAVMTESAAILIWLCEQHPDAGLAPAAGDPMRGPFLRWMAHVSAAIYSLYWVRDDPVRLVGGGDQATVLEKTADRIADCWRMMDQQVSPGPWILGERMSVLDLYVAVVSRFRPRRERFYAVAPKMTAAVRGVDALPQLQAFWPRRYPFEWDAA